MTNRVNLGQLVSNSELYLEGIELPAGWEERFVAGAHVVEVDEPAQWILPEWALLTTGMRVSEDPQAQRRMVQEIAPKACALIYGTLDQQPVPEPIVSEAGKLGLPLLRASEASSFREIIRFVYEASTTDAAYTYNRLATLQRFLLDAFGEDRPAALIVERLSSFLSMPVLVFDGTGQTVLASHAIANRDEVFEAVRQAKSNGGTVVESIEDAEIMAVPVPGVDGQSYWLTLVNSGPLSPPSFIRSSLQLAAPMLVATDRLGAAERASDEAAGQAYLDELLNSGPDSNIEELTARATAFGVTFDRRMRIVFSHSTKPSFGPGWRRAMRRSLLHLGVPHLIKEDIAGVVLMVDADSEPVEELLRAAVKDDTTLWVGIGRPLAGVTDIAESLRDAKLAARPVPRRRQDGRVRRHEDLDLPSLLMSDAKAERVAPTAAKLMAGLEENPMLLDTLSTYFDCDCDVRKAARKMQLHENTVRYRLTRIEKLVGASIRNPATIAGLYLAMLSREVETPGGYG